MRQHFALARSGSSDEIFALYVSTQRVVRELLWWLGGAHFQ